jgi:hypothetical protein
MTRINSSQVLFYLYSESRTKFFYILLKEKKFREKGEGGNFCVVTICELQAKLRLGKRGFRIYGLSTSYLSNEGFFIISKKSNNFCNLIYN